jgi:calmodulin
MSENALAPEKIAEARKEFDFFDADGSGTIGFGLIDKNNDGSIDFEEFLEWWQQSWWEY